VILALRVLSAASLILSAGELAPVHGAYVLRLEPPPSCHAPESSYSFRVVAAATGGPRAGVRLLPRDARLEKLAAGATEPVIEMELAYASRALSGSIATMPWQDAGVRAEEGSYLWIQGIANGSIAAGSRSAEVWYGTMVADLSFGRAFDDRDGLGQCKAALGRWSLRIQ
jgi:hypothetical protein